MVHKIVSSLHNSFFKSLFGMFSVQQMEKNPKNKRHFLFKQWFIEQTMAVFKLKRLSLLLQHSYCCLWCCCKWGKRAEVLLSDVKYSCKKNIIFRISAHLMFGQLGSCGFPAAAPSVSSVDIQMNLSIIVYRYKFNFSIIHLKKTN